MGKYVQDFYLYSASLEAEVWNEHTHTQYEHIHRCIQMGHFHWLGGGSSTSGSHGFHSDIFLDRASSHSACTQDTHTVLNNTYYPINDTQFIIMLFTTGKKTVFPADRQTDTILLLKLSNTHLISCFTRLFMDGSKQTKSIMRSAAVSLAPALLLPKVTLCFT